MVKNRFYKYLLNKFDNTAVNNVEESHAETSKLPSLINNCITNEN